MLTYPYQRKQGHSLRVPCFVTAIEAPVAATVPAKIDQLMRKQGTTYFSHALAFKFFTVTLLQTAKIQDVLIFPQIERLAFDDSGSLLTV